MSRTHLILAAACVLMFLSVPASAQVPPFFNGGGGIFDPEVSTVESGVVFDAQAVVSFDRKYVTLNTRLQNAQLLALREFAFQTGPGGQGGQVGGNGAGGGAGAAGGAAVGAAGAAGAGRANALNPPAAGSRARVLDQDTISRKPYPAPGKAAVSADPTLLEKTGMTLVGRVKGVGEIAPS